MSRNATTPIHLLDAYFYTRQPHRHFQWMRQHAPVYGDATGAVWGIALHAASRAPYG